MLHWALTAVALLLFLFAVRTVFSSARAGEDGRKLGCGFAFVATLLWIYVLNAWLADPWPAVRIGVGAFLLLPAVEALAKPGGARLLRAAIGLFLAVLIAGPPLRAVWTEHGPDMRPADERELVDLIEEIDRVRPELVRRRDALERRRAELRAEVFGGGRTFEEVESDPARLESLQVFVNFDRAYRDAEADLAMIDARLPLLHAALAAVRDGSSKEPTEEDELDALLRALESAPSIEELSLVEREVRKMELEAYFDEHEQSE